MIFSPARTLARTVQPQPIGLNETRASEQPKRQLVVHGLSGLIPDARGARRRHQLSESQPSLRPCCSLCVRKAVLVALLGTHERSRSRAVDQRILGPSVLTDFCSVIPPLDKGPPSPFPPDAVVLTQPPPFRPHAYTTTCCFSLKSTHFFCLPQSSF